MVKKKTLIEFKNVTKIYHVGEVDIKAIEDVNFEISEGEFVVVLGASGAGKTTILNILGGMENATSGEVIVGANNIASYNDDELCQYRRNDIGFVFQFYNLIQNLTARENVELALQICKDPLDAVEVLKLVGLENRLDSFPSQLSGGEQQRIAIARAIVNDPVFVIADEPTGNLDPETSWDIMEIFKEINATGTTIVMATHDKEVVDAMGKRVIAIEKGRIVRDEKEGVYGYEL